MDSRTEIVTALEAAEEVLKSIIKTATANITILGAERDRWRRWYHSAVQEINRIKADMRIMAENATLVRIKLDDINRAVAHNPEGPVSRDDRRT